MTEQRIAELHAKGVHPWKIAHLLGCTRKHVTTTVWALRTNGAPLPPVDFRKGRDLGPELQDVARRTLAVVAGSVGISVDLIRSTARHHPIPSARRIAALALLDHGLSLKQIGAVFGGQSHSTVVAQVKSATETERNIATYVVVAVSAGAGAA